MSAPDTLLVCRLSALGDVVLTIPTVRALRVRFPDARLEFLARAPFDRVLRDVPGIDARHAWAGKGAALPEAVARRAWDVVLDLSGSGRSRRLLAPLRAGRRLRVRKQSMKRFLLVHARRLGADGSGIVPAVERMLAAAAPLGIDVTPARPAFDVPPPDDEGPVLLAPGAGRGTKRWPAERFAALARRLAEEDGRDVRVIGSAEEAALLERVAAAAGARGRAVPCADLAELPSLAAGCPAAVTNDSGLMHVAEACGIPVVALFGPTDPRLGFAPRHPRSVVLSERVSCSPCDLHGPETCPRAHHACMRDLDGDRVLAALRALLPHRVAP